MLSRVRELARIHACRGESKPGFALLPDFRETNEATSRETVELLRNTSDPLSLAHGVPVPARVDYRHRNARDFVRSPCVPLQSSVVQAFRFLLQDRGPRSMR